MEEGVIVGMGSYRSSNGYFAKTLLVSEGKLEDFRILEFWIEPEYGHVYTLAIARFVR